jgi:hypothetical protein
MAEDEELYVWIDALRARLKRGDFVDLQPVDLGYGTGIIPVAHAIRIMLADLDDLDAQPDSAARRQRLVTDFKRLRELID